MRGMSVAFWDHRLNRISREKPSQGVGGSNPLSPTNCFQLLTSAVGASKPTTWFWPRNSSAPTRINTEVLAQRRAPDRLQNRPQRCDGQTRGPTYCKLLNNKEPRVQALPHSGGPKYSDHTDRARQRARRCKRRYDRFGSAPDTLAGATAPKKDPST